MQNIDLHGYREEEAIGPIQMALLDIADGRLDEVNIITGNGQVLRDLVIEMVSDEGLNWRIEGNNSGSLIIFKY